MGQILLTPEEIEGCIVKYGGFRDVAKAAAKRQLKKVAEWVDTLEFYKDWGGESGKELRDYIKQAILKEVEK